MNVAGGGVDQLRVVPITLADKALLALAERSGGDATSEMRTYKTTIRSGDDADGVGHDAVFSDRGDSDDVAGLGASTILPLPI